MCPKSVNSFVNVSTFSDFGDSCTKVLFSLYTYDTRGKNLPERKSQASLNLHTNNQICKFVPTSGVGSNLLMSSRRDREGGEGRGGSI